MSVAGTGMWADLSVRLPEGAGILESFAAGSMSEFSIGLPAR